VKTITINVTLVKNHCIVQLWFLHIWTLFNLTHFSVRGHKVWDGRRKYKKISFYKVGQKSESLDFIQIKMDQWYRIYFPPQPIYASKRKEGQKKCKKFLFLILCSLKRDTFCIFFAFRQDGNKKDCPLVYNFAFEQKSE
jgi:hypothetical protein